MSARLSWDEVHRLEVLMRTRAVAMSSRMSQESTCAACGAPLGDGGMRLAGVRMHPDCLPGGRSN
ncbi:MAG: hypothetical protein ACRDM0_12390 [Thermoleophilaceae bacterium]